MKLLIGVLVAFAVVVSPAEAGLFGWMFGSSDKLPRPIDAPVVRPKLQETHKVGKKSGRHPGRYAHADYGNEWDKTLTIRKHHRLTPWVYRSGIE